MDKVYIVYWSQTGNTQAMAEAIAKGVTDAGKEAVLKFVTEASLDVDKIRQSCQFSGTTVCVMLLYNFLIMFRKIQIPILGKGGDVPGIKLSHKIAALGFWI